MPREPILSSPRAQSVAVAAMAGLLLLAATGLAHVQAGKGSPFMVTPYQPTPLPQSTDGQSAQTLLIITPTDWQASNTDDNRTILIDPQRPTRQILMSSIRLQNPGAPALNSTEFFLQQLTPRARQTFTPVSAPSGFKVADTGLIGYRMIGVSLEDDTHIRQHLIACLSYRGSHLWWIHLTDVTGQEDDAQSILWHNARLFHTIVRSARLNTPESVPNPNQP
ncbi:MAG: hypothetical protein Kow00105_06970 [Phycisphaeraceae bacterium]